MRYSHAFIPTLKESPADAQVASHVYLVRGGFIRRVAAGVYNFLPLGWKVVKKIEDLVRDEMNRAGAQEVLMPAAVPAELWQESGRWEKYGPELLRFKDRKGADFCIGPTHEEVIVEMVRRDTSSYRDLPLNLYQVQSKFRDEMRPRAGLMRGREFIMKDAYSFDRDEATALAAYERMYAAYGRIFRRAGLEFRAVEADTGAIGGSRSHEFQVLAESGEDAIVSCDTCDYAANVEQAEVAPASGPGITLGADGHAAATALTSVPTPKKKTIAEVAAFLGVPLTQVIKSMVYVADGQPVMALVRGDRTVNEVALRRALGATAIYLARDEEVKEATGVLPGFVGPIGLASKMRLIADHELRGGVGAACGANAWDAHYVGVDVERDLPGTTFASLRVAEGGDRCPRCGTGTFRPFKGIEVGHVFFLGTKYSEPMKCTFLDEDGATKPMVMGCYGIGITRIAAAAIEQNHDAGGIVWPIAIAPFDVTVIALQATDAAVMEAATSIYTALHGAVFTESIEDGATRRLDVLF
ncbi:MAG: proline--tRNA ligase, partial [Kofleriaceae bacterium]